MRWRGLLVGVGVMAVGTSFAGADGALDYSPWDRLLRQYVRNEVVDYRALAAQRQALDAFLETLRETPVSHLPNTDHQLAFWINAYNASVIKGVLDHYPLQSVKDVKGFFDSIRYRVAGEDLTLNEMESRGRALGDFRIHFAVVCASSSCPVLRSEAYMPEHLEVQLTEQTRTFLDTPQRGLRLEESSSALWISRIFDWYREDFGQPRGTFGFLSASLDLTRLIDDLEPWLRPDAVAAIRRGRWKVRFMDYDWSLNDVARDEGVQ